LTEDDHITVLRGGELEVVSCPRGDKLEEKMDALQTSFENHFSEIKNNGKLSKPERIAVLTILAGALVKIIETVAPLIL
jgi:hypothetical protein